MYRHTALLSRLDHRLPARQTDRSTHADALMLTAGLAFALVGMVPAVAFAVQWLSLPIPLPALLATGVVLAGYAAVVVLVRRPVIGTFSALIVLSTFAADVPLGLVERGLRGTPGLNLWLFEIPLLVGLGIAAFERWDRDMTLSRTHLLFAGFVVWAFLAAVFGAGPRPLAAATYAFHFFVAFAVFALVAAAVERDVLDLRTVAALLAVAVCAQAVFAAVQLLHGGPFGFSRLGETGRFIPIPVSFGPIRLTGGVYLSGFTGVTNALLALAVLIAPVALAYAFLARARTRTRAVAGAAAVGLFALVTLTAKDSARGAAFVAVVAFIGSLAIVMIRRPMAQFADVQQLVGGVIVLAASFVALLTPSTQSGGALNVPDDDANGGGGSGGGGGGGGGSGGGGIADSSAATAPDPTLFESLEGVHIPLFDLGTLGIRAQQYISAVDVAFQHPLFGLGGANFPYIAVERYGIRPARGAVGPITNGIHNAYFQALASTGLPGFVLFCATLVGTVWACVNIIRNRTVELWLGLGLFAAFGGFLAYIFWTVSFVSVTGSIPFWILAGAVVGAHQHKNDSDIPSNTLAP